MSSEFDPFDGFNTYEDIVSNVEDYIKIMNAVCKMPLIADSGFNKNDIKSVSPFLTDEQIESIVLLAEMI